MSNATPGVLPEYLVAQTLGVAGGVRAEWAAHDLAVAEGSEEIQVEVKSAAYVHSGRRSTVKIAGMNVLNYFTTLDTGAPVCGPARNQDCRGANTSAELTRHATRSWPRSSASTPTWSG